MPELATLYATLAGIAGAIDPLSTIYGALAGTYGGAAYAAASNDHHALVRCYVLSAFLHGLIGVCHHFHM